MKLIATKKGHEFWVQYDEDAEAYEMFKSQEGDDYVGCFATIAEARAYIPQYLAEVE
jgi:hypothetical protein